MVGSKENPADWLAGFQKNGFAILSDALPSRMVSELIDAIERAPTGVSSLRQRGQDVYAMRNLIESVPAVQTLADSAPMRALVKLILGSGAFAVRGLLFDKTPEANWKVPWHQDLTIAVRHRVDVSGFGPWSIKAGVQHVQPPVTVLEQMLTVRLHLDDCPEENGPLQVLPGSHTNGRLTAADIRALRASTPAVSCAMACAGVILMRPLLLHASSPSQRPGHRRVIHLEFAANPLPGGLVWLAEHDQPV
ncbi:MAG: protein involved in biosynthesis of mitomycin antibiotics/polyketide fumonisin [Pedosphaera sp.]|nr:protein involved in biosynthesis of mitomycin antibiotics/polyketide fumonisin [Pedosphaera sp.]